MPELPEVETVRRTLAPHLVGARATAVNLRRSDICTGACGPRELLVGATITALHRRGKQLVIAGAASRSAPEQAVVVHLGMSGQLFALEALDPSLTHVHCVWTFQRPQRDAFHLAFRDPRRFGGLWTGSLKWVRDELWADLGPDAAEIDGRTLFERLDHSRRPIKAALLDQAVLAGVGNIYADEALFRAGIHPQAPASSLDARTTGRLATAIRRVLAQAIKARGSTLRDYRDGNGEAGTQQLRHAVYGRGGEACRTCGEQLSSALVAQRTTVWCPQCQSSQPRRRNVLG